MDLSAIVVAATEKTKKVGRQRVKAVKKTLGGEKQSRKRKIEDISQTDAAGEGGDDKEEEVKRP